MRHVLVSCLGLLVAVAFFAACNSTEKLTKKSTSTPAQLPKSPNQATQPATNPPDNARRITAQELHALWEKNEVLVVDTRNEVVFKQSHIKGAVLIPSNEFGSRSNELPRNKMIVTYCT